MGQVVYVDTGVVPEAPRAELARLGHTLVADDGKVWDLTGDLDGPVVLMAGDVQGLDDPEVDFFTSEAAALPGARYRGSRDKARQGVYLPVMIQGASAEEYLENQAAFRRSVLHPRRPATWIVQRPDGKARSLAIRYHPDPAGYGIDPLAEGFEVAGLRFVALDPYWRGEMIPRRFQIGGSTQPFIPPAPTYGPPLYISQASTATAASIPNPGDEPAFVKWGVAAGAGGIAAGMQLGVGDRVLGVVPALAAGDALTVDTARKTTTLNGTRVRGILSPHAFAAVDPGDEVPLTITATGTGTVTAELVPLYRRGF